MGVARQIDCLIGDGTFVNRNMELLESLVNFLTYAEAQGLCTRVASQNGDGGVNGADFGIGDTGNNAWAYFEFDQGVHLFGLLVQATAANNFGTAPGDPGTCAAATSALGIQMAVREDGLSPWNTSGGATTNDDGADSKGDPVWDDGVSTCHVFPMSNNPAPPSVGTRLDDYSHATQRHNCVNFGSLAGGSNYHRAHFWCNEDGVFFTVNQQNNGNYTQQFACGRYAPMSHMAADLPLPYFMLRSSSGDTGVFSLGPSGTVADQNEYGSRTGNKPSEEGGVLARLADGVIRFLAFIVSTGTHNSTYQPNMLYPTPRYELVPFCLIAFEDYPIHRFGLLGYLPSELYAYSDEVVVNETNAAATIAVFSHLTATTAKMAVSWDGGAAPSPASNTTGGPLGRQSFTA